MKQTIKGPCGIEIQLDTESITPAMVHLGKESGVFQTVVQTGEFISGTMLRGRHLNWLREQCGKVNKILD
jgi:hypothetical protein